ncbi:MULTISPECIES: polysaccharide pyruvyl transferase family protein [Moorena]|uniref:Polysaccharide pyruvyl transferase domain-containing protein n=3 Tax=Moorena TaxID=1155738 RepID=F4XX40_9CYAN|nr:MULTISPECIES: polysaccharide pyruvyl transferase family protein [Moorena]EGJ30925.1 hypothetical protein LYNGBM3L_45900 [Moorena producens 3L]NEP64885.1 polysaccharide pyruvyl transferase family protein [Moorena sp. SIO3A5]OLT66762.1 polysaccharide pyruvyl transferase [Moorena producens 3L]
MNIFLIGYYGYGNIGDDLFVKQLTDYFARKKNVKKIFICCQTNYYQGLSHKVVFFRNAQLSKLKRTLLLFKSDCIAWGGGTLNLQDRPRNLSRMQALSKLMGKRFCFLGVGLESVKSEKKKKIADIFEKADLLYLRDNHSYEMALQQLQLAKSPDLGGDLAFLDLTIYEKFVKPAQQASDISNISFSGKFWWGEGRAEFYAKQLMPLIEKYNCMIHLLPGHLGNERNDNRFHERLKKYLPASNCQINSWKNPEEFLAILRHMDFHIGNRLHSIILADLLGIANIGIVNSESKIKHYIDKSEMLPTARVVNFMEPLSLERIETIFKNYKRPEEFICQESKTAKECLDKVFANR